VTLKYPFIWDQKNYYLQNNTSNILNIKSIAKDTRKISTIAVVIIFLALIRRLFYVFKLYTDQLKWIRIYSHFFSSLNNGD